MLSQILQLETSRYSGICFESHTYPHHVLRENKQATGAGADRVSQGMRCAFGKNVGTAARVKRAKSNFNPS